ncbi:MAG: hypothetical protein ACI9TH_003286 [Kiritimatiellia bacterium]|jgi:hypothetical protein
MIRYALLLLLLAFSASARDAATLFADPQEAATWQWILARTGQQQHVERGSKGEVKWIGFWDEEKQKGDYYRGSLTLDAEGYVVKMTFNAAHFTNDEYARFIAFKRLETITTWHNGWDPNGSDKTVYSGAGLSHLKGSKVAHFNIGGSWFNDEGMVAANQLPSLRELKVYHTRVTDQGVKALWDNPHLTYLNLGPQHSQKVSDACLEAVSTISGLEKLDLDEMLLSWEGGLQHLVALKHLKKLQCKKSFIPEADLERLRAALPDVEIDYEPADEATIAKMRARQK